MPGAALGGAGLMLTGGVGRGGVGDMRLKRGCILSAAGKRKNAGEEGRGASSVLGDIMARGEGAGGGGLRRGLRMMNEGGGGGGRGGCNKAGLGEKGKDDAAAAACCMEEATMLAKLNHKVGENTAS